MDKFLECAKAFENLLSIEYRIILGKKGKLIQLNINFKKTEFHHLMGLGKLIDMEFSKENRNYVFNNILNKTITYKYASSSKYFNKINDRFAPLSNIEKILDSNEIIFRYNEKNANFSKIQADFLLATPFDGNDVYIFISKQEEENYFCRSFFPRSNRDYTKGQTKFIMLYKEKVNLHTGEVWVQFDKLNKK